MKAIKILGCLTLLFSQGCKNNILKPESCEYLCAYISHQVTESMRNQIYPDDSFLNYASGIESYSISPQKNEISLIISIYYFHPHNDGTYDYFDHQRVYIFWKPDERIEVYALSDQDHNLTGSSQRLTNLSIEAKVPFEKN